MKCSVDGCDNEAKQRFGGDNKFYCGKHLHHMYRHGRILEHHRRSELDFVIEDDIVYISLYDNKGNYINTTIIDVQDIDEVKKYRCSFNNSNGYVLINNEYETLHRFLMKPKCFDLKVDHINGNKLDNRRCNLRIVTNQQNQFNQKNDGRGSNNRKGVSYRKDRNKWRAYITVDNKQINLGYFNTEEEAIKAREEAEVKYFGDYRRKEQ